MIRHIVIVLTMLFLGWASITARAQSGDLIPQKKAFELPSYTTVAGETIKSIRIGWEAAGTLNADKSNAILITHYFSGTSHAFGKYAPADQITGYWDAIIGPGKAIDTNRYYVLSSDTLVNLNAKQSNVVTTGPASINPDTGKPYGISFPVVSIKDFVRVQKALIDSLGIKKLKAVVGLSMGGLQAYEWAQSYPESVERIVPVVATASTEPFLIAWMDLWAQPIRLDPKWNNGDYYGKESPLDGLKAALKIVTLQANGWEWARKTFGTAPAQEGKDPAKAFTNDFKINAFLDQAAVARWPAPGLDDTQLSKSGLPLELHRAQITDRRVSAFRVVEALDIVKHVCLCFIARPVRFVAGALGLQRREEALHRGVVPHVA
jgi:homoserine O-acetyltransferase